MKKLCFLVLFILGLTLSLSKVVRQVNADYSSTYQNYVNSTGSYQNRYNDYLVARANYLASGSLESQKKAEDATLAMLQARDNLIANYLNAISAKLDTNQGTTDSDKSTLKNEINTEIGWYNAHNTKLSSAGSLSDLQSDSDEAKTQWTNSTLILVEKALVTLGNGNNSFIRDQINGQISSLNTKIAEIKSNQDKDTGLIERSLIDVQNKISRSQEKDSEALGAVNALKPNTYSGNDTFSTIQQALLDASSYLKEANQGLLQIITQIKTK